MFPISLLPHNYPDPNNSDNLQPRSEVERRDKYIDMLGMHVARSQQSLIDLVKLCLHNSPEKRPSSDILLDKLSTVREKVECIHGSSAAKLIDAGRVLIIKEIKVNV